MKDRSSVIHGGFALFLLVMASLFVIPRWAAGGKQALDAGIAALGMILLILVVALLIAVVLVVLVIVLRKSISRLAMVAGLMPLPLLVAGVLASWMMARREAAEAAPPPNLKPTAPAAVDAGSQ
jgi:hypothetical protein